MDHDHLQTLRAHHPAWKLLRADSAPFVAAVLHRVFVAGNARVLTQDALVEAVDDFLFELRGGPGADPYPRTALQYVTDWADVERGWLRKFYPPGSDVPSYDLTPGAEKALAWLASLTDRSFVGTESRLWTLFGLLQQLVEGSQEDPQERLAILHRRRAELDEEIAAVERGEIRVLGDAAVRDRFQQFSVTAQELLSDFRQVEENFRMLDRGVREQIAGWEGSRGALLDDVFGDRDAIADSDQGASFQAFWDFLMAADRQAAFSSMLQDVLALPALQQHDPGLRHVMGDWLKAADAVQVTVAHLSRQLRRFLDDRAYLENRRIAELVRSIETSALALRDQQPAGTVAELDVPRASVAAPMARRLYEPTRSIVLDTGPLVAGEEDVATGALFEQFVVDRDRLQSAVRATLRQRRQTTLAEVVDAHPISQGLAEVVTYLSIADGDRNASFDAGQRQTLAWQDPHDAREHRVEVPLIVFTNPEAAS